MNTYKKLFNNSIIFAVGNLGSKLISIILVPLYTFYLTPSEYGVIDLINTTIMILIPLISASMAEAVLRFSMENKDQRKISMTNAMLICTIGFFIFLVTYPILKLLNIFGDQLIFLYLLTGIQTLQGVISQFLRGIGKVKTFAINGIFTTFLVGTLNIIFVVYLKLGINGYLLSLVLSYLLSVLLMFFSAKVWRYIDKQYIDLEQVKVMLKYSIPLIPNTLMWWLINGSSRFLIGYYIGVSANGLFAVSSRIPALINMVTQVFSQAWQLSAIEEFQNENKKQFYESVFNIYYRVLFLSISAVLLVLKPMFNYLFEVSYFEAWSPVPFLLLGSLFSALAGFLGQIYIASMETKGVFKTSIYAGISSLLFGVILIPIIGINGAGLSSMLSFLIMFVIRYFDAKKYIGFTISWTKFSLNIFIITIQIISLFISFTSTFEIVVNLVCFTSLILFNKRYIISIFNTLRTVILKRRK